MAWSGDEDSFRGFVDKHDLTFPQINDRPGAIFDRFQITYQPAIIVVDADGGVHLLSGALDEAQLEATLTNVTS